MYAAEAVERRGGTTSAVAWGDLGSVTDADAGPWVVSQATPVLRAALPSASSAGEGLVLIGKSLGSYGAPLAAEYGLPAVWLTPLLHRTWVVDALRQAEAPFLLVGGTADPSWDSALAAELTQHVLEIPEADHGLFVPGPLSASATALGQVATAIETFLDTIWTS